MRLIARPSRADHVAFRTRTKESVMKALGRGALCAAALWSTAALAQAETVEFSDGGRKRADTGIYAQLGGGLEGYTGQLAPEVTPGFSYGAALGYRPHGLFAVELGYSGGLSDIDSRMGLLDDGEGGPDIVRNAGQAVVVGSFTDTRLQPYVLTGIGLDRYNVRNDARGAVRGFSDDTSGYVPAGAGLRYQVGNLITADARVNYNFLFDQDFAPGGRAPGALDGRYAAVLSLGGTY
ncbi:outer membrane beta-barrel protein [Myxococcus sp. SDU36]|nr:outer membrane beta-barrel protein [Myxococcus sp. SDU36]